MNKGLRILAGLVGLILIIILLMITMSFTGNPISKLLATRTADKYVEEYSHLDLVRQEIYFEFKNGTYGVKYFKENSKDIHFTIGTDYLGRLTYDGYERDVISKWNTRLRLEEEFSNYVENIIRSNLSYDFNMIFTSPIGEEDWEDQGRDLEIDMIFDYQNIPYDQDLSLYIYEENRTWDRISEILLELDELMDGNRIDISKYTIVLEERGKENTRMEGRLEVLGFPKEGIDSDNLPKDLENFSINNSSFN